jgi:hypothetical protein
MNTELLDEAPFHAPGTRVFEEPVRANASIVEGAVLTS